MANNRQAKQERAEFAGMSAAELRLQLEQAKKQLWTDRFNLGKRTLTNTAEISKTRKRIARIHTYLRQIELNQEAGN